MSASRLQIKLFLLKLYTAMKVETTAMDDLWLGMIAVAFVYMVMRTVSTLERVSKKVDAMVNHIGAEVESASSKLSKEANSIFQSLEKNAVGYKQDFLQNVQSVELQCYRSKHGIAFGFAPRTVKKKRKNHQPQQTMPATMRSLTETQESSALQKPQHHSTLALHKCIDRILKIKCRGKWPLSLSFQSSKHACETTCEIQ